MNYYVGVNQLLCLKSHVTVKIHILIVILALLPSAVMSTDSAASSPTLGQLLNDVNLSETFDQIAGKSQKTKHTTRREKLVRPKLTSVTFTNNEVLDNEVREFLAEIKDIPASRYTIAIFNALDVREYLMVTKKKNDLDARNKLHRGLIPPNRNCNTLCRRHCSA